MNSVQEWDGLKSQKFQGRRKFVPEPTHVSYRLQHPVKKHFGELKSVSDEHLKFSKKMFPEIQNNISSPQEFRPSIRVMNVSPLPRILDDERMHLKQKKDNHWEDLLQGIKTYEACHYHEFYYNRLQINEVQNSICWKMRCKGRFDFERLKQEETLYIYIVQEINLIITLRMKVIFSKRKMVIFLVLILGQGVNRRKLINYFENKRNQKQQIKILNQMQVTQVRASHILQKSVKSRNTVDRYRNKQITRSEEEAIENIKQIRAQLEKEGLDKFATLAEKYSECGSAAKGGDLGLFGKGQMQQAFEEVAFGLKVGELSQMVITDSGVHIILRTA